MGVLIKENSTEYDNNYLLNKIKSHFNYLKNVFKTIDYKEKINFIFYQRDKDISQAKNNCIIINVREYKDKKIQEEVLDIRIRHELVHIFTHSDSWGSAPPLFFEGIATYLADNKIREKRLNYNYHNIAKALYRNKVNIPLRQLILPNEFSEKRHDIRVDVQSCSFVGFVIKKYGLEKLKSIFQNYKKPTPQNPILEINPLLNSIFDSNLEEMENQWFKFLKFKIEGKESLNNEFSKQYFNNLKINYNKNHCVFCAYPLDKNKQYCPICNADKNINVKII